MNLSFICIAEVLGIYVNKKVEALININLGIEQNVLGIPPPYRSIPLYFVFINNLILYITRYIYLNIYPFLIIFI